MIHLTVQQLSSYFDGELNPSSAELVRQHLSSCETCAAGYSELEAQGRALEQALASDPGDEFLARLAERIESQIGTGPARSAGRPPAAARPAPPTRAPRTERPTVPPPAVPPRPAVAPVPRAVVPTRPAAEVAEPVATKAGTPRTVLPPPPPHRLSGRPDRAPFPWAVAAVILVLAVSAGVVFSGAGRGLLGTEWNAALAGGVAATPVTASPSETPPAVQPDMVGPVAAAPEPPAPTGPAASPDQAAPAATPGRTDATAGDPERGGTRADAEAVHSGSHDFEPVAIPADEALAGLAGGASARAIAGGTSPASSVHPVPAPPTSAARADSSPPKPPETAADFDAVASQLERQLDQLRGDDYREARYRLAEARYRAWSLAPNLDRAARAEAAVRAFLVTAREGLERDHASDWLSALEETGFR